MGAELSTACDALAAAVACAASLKDQFSCFRQKTNRSEGCGGAGRGEYATKERNTWETGGA